MTTVKAHTRIIGFDDGPFTFEDETAVLAGVMTRGPGYVEAVLLDEVTVDGRDATETVLDLVEGTGFLETAHAIVMDGGTLAGFNVVDLQALHEATGLPTIAYMTRPPDAAAVAGALRDHFEDAEERLALLTAQPIEEIMVQGQPAAIRQVGTAAEAAEALLDRHVVRGRVPEPLRIAHLVATAVAEGRSRGA